MLDPLETDIALVAARCGSDTLRLEPEWPTVLRWMRRLGRVETRTQNASARFVQSGRFARPSFYAPGRAFVGGDFALACRFDRWKALFATIDERGRRSLRIFDGHGALLGAIDVRDPAGRPNFDEMVWRLHALDQSTTESTHAAPPVQPVARDRTIRFASKDLAWRIPTGFVRAFLCALAERRVDVGCAVTSAGTVHAHTGRVAAVEGVARWTTSFSDGARLTLDAASIASAWVVRTPDAARSILEVFGRSGERVASFGGVAGSDGAALEWRRLVASFAPLPRFA
jgi:putative hemin transport protein